MARSRNRLVQGFLFGIIFLFFHGTRMLPLPVARRITIALGRVALAMLPRLHRVGRANVLHAYGDALSPDEVRRIVRGAMDNMAIVAAEFSRTSAYAKDRFRDQITLDGLDNMNLEGKGVVAIGSHKANWEWLAAGFVANGCPTAEVVRPLDFAPLNRFVDHARRSAGIETIPKEKASEEMGQLLQAGYIVGLLVDQSTRENAVPTTYFGQPCWSTIGAAMVALRMDVPVHYVDMTRESEGRYRMTISPAIEISTTGDTARDLQRITQQFQDLAEASVRKNPEQWLWFHRRWKTRERLEREWQARIGASDHDAG